MGFGSLLSALGIAALKNEVRATARRAGRKAAFGAATGLLFAIAFGFALAALTVWIASELGVIEALLIVAAGAVVIALILQVVASQLDKRPPPRRPYVAAAAPLISDTVGESEPRSAAEPPAGSVAGSMAVVALVGFVLAKALFRR
jgi:hypothetical protein